MGKREELKNRRRKVQQRKSLVPIIIGAVVLVVLGFLILPNILPRAATTRTITKDNTWGDPNAPVKIVEYADFQCPACGRYFATMESEIGQAYINTGKVFYTFSPFSFIGQESVNAAQAAYCAMDQGKFWDYHDMLLTNQRGENQGAFSNTNLVSFARNLSLDVNAFSTCLTSGKYKGKVQNDLAEGQAAGISQTPSFVVDGQKVFAENLISAIDSALAEKGK